MLIAVALYPAIATAQQEPTDAEKPVQGITAGGDTVEKRLEQQQKTIEQLRENEKAHAKRERELIQRLEKIEAAQNKQNQGLQQKEYNLEEQWEEESIEDLERFFKTYGFFDLTFAKKFLAKDDLKKIALEDTSTFTITNLNIYLQSQMTTELMALIEFRLTYLPQGNVANFMPFERQNTEVFEQVSGENFDLGGIAIERAHLTYSPFDWFQITAGHYLTPFGIWNVEHASTVVIATVLPSFQVMEMMPLSQTGLQVFGRYFPSDFIFFDYAATLSNGRGPMEHYMDLDENKGVGLKLKVTIRDDNTSLAVGGYSYYGSYTDNTKSVGAAEPGSEFAFMPIVTIVEAYDEFCQSADFQLDLYGLTLRSEYIFRLVKYDTTRPLNIEELMAQPNDSDLPPGSTQYLANFTGHDVYGLIGYELPIKRWIGSVVIMPFFMYEYSYLSDTRRERNTKNTRFGLNVKPSPFVALKGEYRIPVTSTGTMQALHIQLAVSF